MPPPKRYRACEVVLDGRHHLTLTLAAAPDLLRFVSGDGMKTLDALDQPGDAPKPEEAVVVAKRVRANTVHARYGGKDRIKSGWYLWAHYETLTEQPPDEVARDNDKWDAWAEAYGRRPDRPGQGAVAGDRPQAG